MAAVYGRGKNTETSKASRTTLCTSHPPPASVKDLHLLGKW